MLLILGMGGAVAWHFFKNKMPDQQTKGDTDLDDYDYGIDEDDDLDYDTEPGSSCFASCGGYKTRTACLAVSVQMRKYSGRVLDQFV